MTPLGFLLWSCTEAPLAVLRDVTLVLVGIPFILAAVARYLLVDIPHAHRGQELYLGDVANRWSLANQVGLVLLSFSPLWWLIWGYRLLMVSLQNLLRVLPIEWGLWPIQKKAAFNRQSKQPITFFVNGICVDENWLKLNCNTLSEYLKEEVVGIHNKSYGLIVDLVECILQRDLRFYTESVMTAIEAVTHALEQGRRVRLIGHSQVSSDSTQILSSLLQAAILLQSELTLAGFRFKQQKLMTCLLFFLSQGGIIVSLVVDYLVDYGNPKLFEKLEVYTFASAADKFPSPPKPYRHIPIKHYGNQFDLVSILGVLGARAFYRHIVYPLRSLYYESGDPNHDPHYFGKIFVHREAFGHLLSTNYTFARPSVYTPLNGGTSSPF